MKKKTPHISKSTKIPFPDPLLLEFIDNPGTDKTTKDRRFRLTHAFPYNLRIAGIEKTIIATVGSRTDFASVPPPFRRFFPRVGKYGKAAVIHDYLCDLIDKQDVEMRPRWEADLIFLQAMRDLNVDRVTVFFMYGGVWLRTSRLTLQRWLMEAFKIQSHPGKPTF